MNLLDAYLVAATLLLVISGVLITSNRWWLSLLIKVPYNLTALAGAVLLASRMGWIG